MLPVSMPADPPQCYDTLHSAVDAAAHAALAVSIHYEVGGAVYRAAGRFCYTLPVTANKIEEIDYRVQLPQGSTLAALWHTHPIGRALSIEDKQLADRLCVPMYVIAIQFHAVIGAEQFTLDVQPTVLEFVTYNGVRYIKRGQYLEGPNGRLYALAR